MRTKREQVQAYRFVTRRIVSAMVSDNPEALELPMRRTAISAIVGAVIAALIFGGFWVVGLIFPGGDWSTAKHDTILIDKNTGATYIYVGAQHVLFPTQNLVSAKLAFSDTVNDDDIEHVTTAELSKIPRANKIGIAGAPDAIPGNDSLIKPTWQLCSAPVLENHKQRLSHIMLDRHPSGDTLIGDKRAAAVQDDDGKVYVLWHNKKLKTDTKVLTALELQNPPQLVTKRFLAGIPQGPDLLVPNVKDAGSNAKIDGASVDNGQLARPTDGGDTYVVTGGHFAKIGKTMERMMRNKKGGESDPVSVDGDTINANETDDFEPQSFPQAIPDSFDMNTDDSAVCATYKGTHTTLMVYRKTPKVINIFTGTSPDSADSNSGTVEHVTVPPTKGVLVHPQSSDADTAGTMYVLTDTGVKYPLEGKAAELLGYTNSKAQNVSAALLDLVPEGPTLDPSKAKDGLPASGKAG
ncbi:MAG TPA: type VII secretion protein EccB [Stackebrandtia sp.]|jgi:type VII secretion protein EccB|uniref:type VII secretion protein EccB n=1 Tax=Stackebrandtia sp. TaxID=2023065 RepID=UPI002D6D8A93|nr:type VII secretion protein EccB [Stackebrandtia sp.]HZE40902.1 type VII secretion protein EccB [Stackebrandtia sp.]